MREIKYQAWDKDTKRMLSWGECQKVIAVISASQFFNCDEHFIKREFTGLLDKQGKEIYEGDIIRVGNLNRQIFMRLGCWFAEMGQELGYYDSENIKVIGNIWESPELLINN